MKTKYILYALCGLLVITQSCTDYLDLKSTNNRAVPTTLDHLEALLNDAVKMNKYRTPSLGETWADDYFLLQNVVQGYPDVVREMYVWNLIDYTYPNDWADASQAIYNANYCLEALSKIERSAHNQVQFDQIKGGALFYRAYYFSQLLWIYAPTYDEATAANDKGIVLKMDTDFNTKSVRSSVKDSYVRVINDTEEAIGLLPAIAHIPTQASKQAGYGLLARLYLSMREYEKALDYAGKGLAVKADLMDYNKVSDGVNPSEVWTFTKYNKETIFYTEINSSHGELYAISPVNEELYATYLDNDIRKKAFFTKSGAYFIYRGSYGMNVGFTGLATDELMLIKAECQARLGQYQEGMNTLNELLIFRFDNTVPFIPLTAGSKEQALATILLERRKELLRRGLRWVDIKRLNKEGYNISIKRKIGEQEYVLLPGDSRFVAPLPADLIPFVE